MIGSSFSWDNIYVKYIYTIFCTSQVDLIWYYQMQRVAITIKKVAEKSTHLMMHIYGGARLRRQ